MLDIPPRVTQEELNSKKAHIKTRGTSKEAVTEGDPKLSNLVESSLYDTTRVQYISMVSEELNWVIKEKEGFDVETSNVIKLIFLHMNSMRNTRMKWEVLS